MTEIQFNSATAQRTYERVTSRTSSGGGKQQVQEMFSAAAGADADPQLSEQEAATVEDVLKKHDRWSIHRLGIIQYNASEVNKAQIDFLTKACQALLKRNGVGIESLPPGLIFQLSDLGLAPDDIIGLLEKTVTAAGSQVDFMLNILADLSAAMGESYEEYDTATPEKVFEDAAFGFSGTLNELLGETDDPEAASRIKIKLRELFGLIVYSDVICSDLDFQSVLAATLALGDIIGGRKERVLDTLLEIAKSISASNPISRFNAEEIAMAFAWLPQAAQSLWTMTIDTLEKGEEIGPLPPTFILVAAARASEQSTDSAYQYMPVAVNAMRRLDFKQKEVMDVLLQILSYAGENAGFAYQAFPRATEALFGLGNPLYARHIIDGIIFKAGENAGGVFWGLPDAVEALNALELKNDNILTFLNSLTFYSGKAASLLIGILPSTINALQKLGISDSEEILGYLTDLIRLSGEGMGEVGRQIVLLATFRENWGLGKKDALSIIKEIAENAGAQTHLFLSELTDKLGAGKSLNIVMAEFRTLWNLNIRWIGRFSPEVRAEIVRNRLENSADSRPLAVIIYPTSDWNGAFVGYDGTIFRSVIERGYRVMYYEVSTDTGMYGALLGATAVQKAQLLIIGGHGTQQLTSFGASDPITAVESGNGIEEKYYLDLADARDMNFWGLGTALENEGQVILQSCSTGQGWEGSENIANLLRSIFPQAAAIWAPTVPAAIEKLLFNGKQQIMEVRYFTDSKPYQAIQSPAL